jgi:hypothetical protein
MCVVLQALEAPGWVYPCPNSPKASSELADGIIYVSGKSQINEEAKGRRHVLSKDCL